MSFCSALCHHFVGDHLRDEVDPQGDENQVIEVAQNRDEIGDEVNGAEGVGDDTGGKELGVPGDSGIFVGEIYRVQLLFELYGPALPCLERVRQLAPGGKSNC